MFRSIKSPLLAAMGMLAAAQVALADAPADRLEVGRVIVSYSDLNLGDAGDARVMLGRLQQAAYRACGGDAHLDPDYQLLWPRLNAVYRDCRSEAVSRAVNAVDAPLLSQVFRVEQDQRPIREASYERRKHSDAAR